MNGADSLCDTLLANDVRVCFANPGTSEMHFVAALDRKPQMRCVLGLSEGVVTGAADGYARMTDRPAATLLHTGPGLANGPANLHNARRARVPVINIVGDHASYHLALDAPLTSDIESLARADVKLGASHQRPRGCGRRDGAAFRASLSPPGVATLILPADAAWGHVETDQPVRLLPAGAIGRGRHGQSCARTPALSEIRPARPESSSAVRLPADCLEIAGAIAAAKDVPSLQLRADTTRVEAARVRVALTCTLYPIDAALDLQADI